MAQNGPAILFRNVYKSFDENPVLRGLNLEIPWGKVTTILGPSGCGKSVTLKHIIGILKADSGQVIVAGYDMERIGKKDLIALRKRIGVLFQSSALFDSMTVKENVAFGLRMHTRTPEAQIDERVAACLAQVDLSNVEHMMPVDLSGGMKKRAALARAIALSPDFVLYDEPTTGLDPTTTNVVAELILKLQNDLDITSVVVTHDLPLARRISDKIALLYRGRVAIEGAPEAVEESDNEIYRQFVAGQPVEREAHERP